MTAKCERCGNTAEQDFARSNMSKDDVTRIISERDEALDALENIMGGLRSGAIAPQGDHGFVLSDTVEAVLIKRGRL